MFIHVIPLEPKDKSLAESSLPLIGWYYQESLGLGQLLCCVTMGHFLGLSGKMRTQIIIPPRSVGIKICGVPEASFNVSVLGMIMGYSAKGL